VIRSSRCLESFYYTLDLEDIKGIEKETGCFFKNNDSLQLGTASKKQPMPLLIKGGSFGERSRLVGLIDKVRKVGIIG